MSKKVRFALFYFLYLIKFRHLVKIQTNSYASHIPIIILSISTIQPIRILETGSGLNSTLVVLKTIQNQGSLTSIENNKLWYESVLAITKSYNNHKLLLCTKVSDYIINNFNGTEFDLIVVDDSDNSKDRIDTINAIFSIGFKNLIIHDYDLKEYRKAVKFKVKSYKFKVYVLEFHDFFPHSLFITTDKTIHTKMKLRGNLLRLNNKHDSSDSTFWFNTFNSDSSS